MKIFQLRPETHYAHISCCAKVSRKHFIRDLGVKHDYFLWKLTSYDKKAVLIKLACRNKDPFLLPICLVHISPTNLSICGSEDT